MIEKIYFYINEILLSYLDDGVRPEHLLQYLNTSEDNFKYLYNRIYRKLTIENIQFESDQLTDALKDSIRDKIALYNDIKNE